MKPTSEEMALALKAAEQLREAGRDSLHVAKCLLFLHHRNEELEKVLVHADRYLRFGTDEHEHARLIKLIQGIREEEIHDAQDDQARFGLE